jgi:Ca2+-binding RTX toxin-like protein
MSTFTGTKANETIRPSLVSPSVTFVGDSVPNSDPDTINSRGGNDTVEGDGGIDQINLGAGNDRVIWNSGDGNDLTDGGAGFDTLYFTGADDHEAISLGGDASGVRLTDDLDDLVLDFQRIERVVISPVEGVDGIDIGDLSGSSVRKVIVNLSAFPNGGGTDGFGDDVGVAGSEVGDAIVLRSVGSTIKVTGLHAGVTVKGLDDGIDELTIKGYGGNDRINASGIDFGVVNLDLEGGKGRDTIIGSRGGDTIRGDDGKDHLRGGAGKDLINGGSGNDRLVGGSDQDFFRFSGVLAEIGVDRVVDFKVGVDLISLEMSTFSALGMSLGADEFRVGFAGQDDNDMVIYDPATGKLYYDADGVAGEDAIQFAKLAKNLDLAHTDFNVHFTI